MDLEKIIEITQNVENKSNKDLTLVELELSAEFEKTKELIIDLTRHLDTVVSLHDRVVVEINKRKKK